MLTLFFTLYASCILANLAAVSARPASRSLRNIDEALVPLAPADPRDDAPWQLWYFDIVSDSDQSSLQVAFYSGFPFSPILGRKYPYYVQLSGTFGNGTAWGSYYAPTSGLGRVYHSGPTWGSAGDWPGIGGWVASGEDSSASYIITFDTGRGGIVGELMLDQIAPPHYPCDR